MFLVLVGDSAIEIPPTDVVSRGGRRSNLLLCNNLRCVAEHILNVFSVASFSQDESSERNTSKVKVLLSLDHIVSSSQWFLELHTALELSVSSHFSPLLFLLLVRSFLWFEMLDYSQYIAHEM